MVRRSVEPGTQVAEAAELVAIAPVSAIGFEAHIPPEVSPRVRLGQRAMVVEQGRPARGATVQRVLPAADPADQTTLVWLTPQPPVPLPQLEHFGKAAALVAIGDPWKMYEFAPGEMNDRGHAEPLRHAGGQPARFGGPNAQYHVERPAFVFRFDGRKRLLPQIQQAQNGETRPSPKASSSELLTPLRFRSVDQSPCR